MHSRRKLAGCLILCAFLSGCIFFPSAHDKAIRKSPSFQAGYSDGCSAGTAQGANYREGPYRNEALFKSDELYRAGWSSGFRACRPVPDSGTPPGANPVPSPFGH